MQTLNAQRSALHQPPTYLCCIPIFFCVSAALQFPSNMSDGTAKLVFSIANKAVLPSWLAIAFLPNSPHTSKVVKSSVLLTAACYAFSLLRSDWPKGGNFGSLRGVRTIFQKGCANVHNACWIHFLCYDLFVGNYINKDAIKSGMPRKYVIPCLFVALMYPPAGFLLYNLLKYILARKLVEM